MSIPGNDSFQTLLSRVQSGDERAATELVETYGGHVMRAVRRTIRREIRSKFDSIDFAQLVWTSVFANAERLNQIQEPSQLVRWLTAVARNKVIDENRRRTCIEKHTVRREESLSFDDEGPQPLIAREPTPSQIAMARERWQQLLSRVPERDQKIMRLKVAGKTNQTIARMLSVNERTVRRVLERLKQVRG